MMILCLIISLKCILIMIRTLGSVVTSLPSDPEVLGFNSRVCRGKLFHGINGQEGESCVFKCSLSMFYPVLSSEKPLHSANHTACDKNKKYFD